MSSRGSCGRGAGTVRVLGMGETAAMPPDARANRERWETMGAVEPLTHAGLRDAPESDLYIDAVFGTGLKRAPDGDLLELLRDLGSGRRALRGRLVAVDAPSGLDLDSGRMLAGGRAEPALATRAALFADGHLRGAEGGACPCRWSRHLRADRNWWTSVS
jgi:NAD(P)H-hydrate repair Nnr-like enzyme with NAD(P)H-hydrate epimerase domain